MDRMRKNKVAIAIFILPALIWFVAIAIIPIFQSLGYSLLNWNGITIPKFVGLANYADVLRDPLFWKAVGNSLLIAAATILLELPIALLLALVLAGKVRGAAFYRTAYFVPVVIASVIIAQLWQMIYHPNYGLLNVALEGLGLGGLKQTWLASPKLAMGAVIAPMLWQNVGYHMLLFYSAVSGISPDIKEAAMIDGATERQISWHIVIPMIVPMIRTCVTFGLIGAVKSFDIIYSLTQGGPLHATEVPTILMYKDIFFSDQYGRGSSGAILIVLECLLFTLLVQKAFKRFEYNED